MRFPMPTGVSHYNACNLFKIKLFFKSFNPKLLHTTTKSYGFLQNGKHAPIQLKYAYVSRTFETAECATWLYQENC